MQNPTGTDIPEATKADLACNHPGYIQAISNCAYYITTKSTQIVDDFLNGDSTDLDELVKLINNPTIDFCTFDGIQHIVDEITPEICNTYSTLERKITPSDVTRDIISVTEYYSNRFVALLYGV